MSGALAAMLSGTAAGLRVVDYRTAQINAAVLTLPYPALGIGDLLLALRVADSATGWISPSGWAEVLDIGTIAVSQKTASGFEGAGMSFPLVSGTGSHNLSGIMLSLAKGAYAGIGVPTTPVPDPAAPSITMTAPGLVLAFFWSDKAGISFTTPAGFTPVAADADGTKPSWALFSKRVTAGATGAVSSTPSSDNASGVLVGVREI